MKNLPISVQQWKPVWICACKGTLGIGTKAFKQIFLKHLQKINLRFTLYLKVLVNETLGTLKQRER